MGFLKTILSIITIPLILLDWLGVIVAGIWLTFLGEWGILGTGAICMITAPLVLSFILLPGILFAGISATAMQKSPILGFIISLPSLIYTKAVLSAWCVASFFWVENIVKEDALIPGLVWGYAIATSPWTYFASKERDNDISVLNALVTQAASAILMISLFFFKITFKSGMLIFGSIIGLVLLIEVLYSAYAAYNAHKSLILTIND